MIIHKKNGLLVETENASAFTDAISRFIEDADLACNCSAAAQKDAMDNFSSAILADAYTRLVFNLAGNENIN